MNSNYSDENGVAVAEIAEGRVIVLQGGSFPKGEGLPLEALFAEELGPKTPQSK